jgi:hypothetical protein
MKDLSFRLAKSILPRGLPLHLLLETGGRSEVSPFKVEIISLDHEVNSPAMTIESFRLPTEHFAVAYRVETGQMDPGEHLAVLVSEDRAVEWEESFWVLDVDSYQLMLDEVQADEFDDYLRISRADVSLLLRRKLIESGDEISFPASDWPLSERYIPTLTKVSSKFVGGGPIPISRVNFAFDRLLEDFMYLSIFNPPVPNATVPGQSRSIILDVNETGDISIDAEANLSVLLPSDFIKVFTEHSALTQVGRRWPEVFHSDLVVTPNYVRLRLVISQNLQGTSTPNEEVIPGDGTATTAPVSAWEEVVQVDEEEKVGEEAEAGAL